MEKQGWDLNLSSLTPTWSSRHITTTATPTPTFTFTYSETQDLQHTENFHLVVVVHPVWVFPFTSSPSQLIFPLAFCASSMAVFHSYMSVFFSLFGMQFFQFLWTAPIHPSVISLGVSPIEKSSFVASQIELVSALKNMFTSLLFPLTVFTDSQLGILVLFVCAYWGMIWSRFLNPNVYSRHAICSY